MFSNSLHLLNTGFIFEDLIKPTPYTIGTKYIPKLATTTIFVKNASIFLQIRYRHKPSLTTSRSTIKSCYIHLLLVPLLSGQVELNPGPVTPNQSSTFSTNYPCGIRQKKVNDSHHALLCDKCELWFYTDCLKFPVSYYSTILNFTSFIWVCTNCGYSNYSHRTPNLNPILSCTNSYSILTICSDDDNDLPINCFFSSTPANNKAHINETPPIFSNKVRKVKVMIINCNGVNGPSKQTALLATLDIHKPNIVLGCESKLCISMCGYEFFPMNYTIFRIDRNVNGGGVLVATSDKIISYEIPDLDTDCVIIWAGLHFSGSNHLYLASFYKPPNTTSQPLEALASCNKLITLHMRSSPNVIISGDFNLPGIDWESWQAGCTTESQHKLLLDFLLYNSLSQLISQATRPTSNNILDLLIISSPNLIENIQAVPGLSDHLAIIFDVNLKPHMPMKPSRKVYQFHKADKISLKMKAKAFLDKFIKSDPTKNDIFTNWCTIKSILGNLLDDYVPYRTTKSGHNLTWITNDVKRSMRKRDRLFL